jgi:flagellum-specific ATP synthase
MKQQRQNRDLSIADPRPQSHKPHANPTSILAASLNGLRSAGTPIRVAGHVRRISAATFDIAGISPFVARGDRLTITSNDIAHTGEVLQIDPHWVTAALYQHDATLSLGARAWHLGRATLAPHASWKGRCLDPLGNALDGGKALTMGARNLPIDCDAPAPLQRQRVETPMPTGIRAVDIFTPLCAGQRIGIFSGSGVGKTSLLGMLARATAFDTVVIALIGERGREVREFLEDVLGPWRARVVAVIATSDSSPLLRRLAPKTAMCVAEHFRDEGQSVLLIIDSMTRFAHAARDVALAAGELPVARGFPPSVLAELPRILERAGPGPIGSGSISAVVSVLVDGDDMNEPIADTIRGILDGHIILDRAIAAQGRFPAIDILHSISRLSQRALTPEQQRTAIQLRGLIAKFEATRDLRTLGGHLSGADPELDDAVRLVPRLTEALKQPLGAPESKDPFAEVIGILKSSP